MHLMSDLRAMKIWVIVNRFLRGRADKFETNRFVWLALFGTLYAALAFLRSLRPFWYDELITYHVATLPRITDVWRALTEGADLNPPLFYIVTRAFTSVFGFTEVALRLPAIVGFLVLCCCLYIFVARRAGPGFGFVAFLFPLTTGAFVYASEARPYGLALGFCGLALVSWQRAAERSPRALALVGMGMALTAAILTHCYAVLMLAPFAVAQVVRDFRRRKLDWAMWIALILPLCACFSYFPLLAAFRPFAYDNSLFRPTWFYLIRCYAYLLTPALWPLAIGGMIVAGLAARRRNPEPDKQALWTLEEVSLAAGFLLVPVFALLLAKFATHIFQVRYGLSATIGVAILFAQLGATVTGRSRRAAAALTLLLSLFPIAIFALKVAREFARPPQPVLSLEQRPDLPLVISNGELFYERNHYADTELAGRVYYLTDEERARRVTGCDVFDKGLPLLNRFFPLRAKLEDYDRFLATHPHFLVYGYADYETDWLIPELLRDGARLSFLGQHREEWGPAVLYEVSAATKSYASTE